MLGGGYLLLIYLVWGCVVESGGNVVVLPDVGGGGFAGMS